MPVAGRKPSMQPNKLHRAPHRDDAAKILQRDSALPVLSAFLVIAPRSAIRSAAHNLFRAFLRNFPSKGVMSAVMRHCFFESKLACNLRQ
jgi:hypothetical protein